MTAPLVRLASVRRSVAAALAVRTLSIAAVAGGAILVLAVGLDAALGLPRAARWLLVALALAGAVVAGLRVGLQALRARSDQALAVWVESRIPLDYLLVTAADPRFAGDVRVKNALEDRAFEPVARRAAWLGTRAPLATAGLLALGLFVIPGPRLARVMRPQPGDVLNVTAGAGVSRLRPLVARYTAPAYAGGGVATFEEPTTVRGLEGGSIEIVGHGSAAGLALTVGDRALRATDAQAQWHAFLTMPRTPTVVRLGDGDDERLLVLEPVPDSVPRVSLRLPARDTVVRVASGVLSLDAVALDDLGLSTGWFEYVLSSGTGELFEFRTGVIGRRPMGGRADSLRGMLDLGALALKPGDVLHVRAVATDMGPPSRGAGFSDTRTLRVARRDESDTSSVIVLPPLPSDTAALSERVLIQLAEALEARRARLERRVVLGESQGISRDQARLRRDVSDVIFMRLSGEAPGEERDGAEPGKALDPEELLKAAEATTAPNPDQPLDFAEDESPVVAVNRPLLEAYNAMWDASRELDIGEPGRALPHMRIALEAIQRARAAERIYLRGRAPRVVVNLAQVRLSGKRDGVVTGDRIPGPSASGSGILDRFFAGVARLSLDPGAARDSLLVLRVELLTESPAAAAALGEAISRLRSGEDPIRALAAVRSALGGPPGKGAGITAWGAGGIW